jgi:hypothetical protein
MTIPRKRSLVPLLYRWPLGRAPVQRPITLEFFMAFSSMEERHEDDDAVCLLGNACIIASICAFSVPSALTYQSRNPRASFHLQVHERFDGHP